jgi:hypothetical protein
VLEQEITRGEWREIEETRWRNAPDHALEAWGKNAANVFDETVLRQREISTIWHPTHASRWLHMHHALA